MNRLLRQLGFRVQDFSDGQGHIARSDGETRRRDKKVTSTVETVFMAMIFNNYFWVPERLFIQVSSLQNKQETARTTGSHTYHDALACICGSA